MALATGKIAVVMFEKAMETYEHQMDLLPLVSFDTPDPGQMQNSGNFIWRPIQQHAPIIEGWTLTGDETGIIEETYPSILGTPKNDFVQQRADDLRDMRFWERRGEQSGKRQATELNKLLATAITVQGAQFYRSNDASGYDFIAEAQAILNERQQTNNDRFFLLNDRDTLKFASDLASRETIKGRPADTWATGQIGSNVAEFDVFTGSFLPNITGGASPATTCTGAHSFAPEAGTVNATTGVVTNVDCRSAELVVAASAGFSVGDKITLVNPGTGALIALGLADKTETGQAMVFTVVAKADATHMTIYPKPIAADDAALSTLEKAYANVDTTILNACVPTRINTDASKKANLFWDKQAIEVMGGNIPADLFKQYDGMKVITDTMKNGQTMYMVYDGNIETMNFRFRIFTWYGITVCYPQNCGVAVTYT